MEEQKGANKAKVRQSTIPSSLIQGQIEESRDHLISHLLDDDIEVDNSSMWTGVFPRDIPDGKQMHVRPIGPDLTFDTSVRLSMGDLLELKGKVLFSPLLIKRNELSPDLESGKLPTEELIKLGHIASKAKNLFTDSQESLKGFASSGCPQADFRLLFAYA